MKPLNLNKESCSPVSSNCVIWQGPDIECINLCKGDSVTEVVYKLATELCDLLETFNVDNYDISCFNLLECAPDDFEGLIQLLIDKVCACCGETPTVNPGTGALGCPDCEVTICPDFYYENPQGDTQTTMQLQDYVVAIGNKICQQVGQIATQNAIVNNHEVRITSLENKSNQKSPVVLPTVTPKCVLDPVPTSMDVVLSALEKQFCDLRTATGDPNAIYQSLLRQCEGLNNADQLTGSGSMSTIPGWVSTVTNMSNAVTNIWLTICDIRAAITTIQANCCDTGCDGISISIQAVITNPLELKIYFTGTVPGNFIDCTGGSVISITDTNGGTVNLNQNLISSGLINDPSGFVFNAGPTPVDPNLDLTVTVTHCFTDPATGTQCSGVAMDVAPAAANCPTLSLTPLQDSIIYGFTWVGIVPKLVTVELADQFNSLITTQSTNVSSNGQFVSGTFAGLTAGTDYTVRITYDNKECVWEQATTLNAPCNPPTNGSAQLIQP